MDFCALHLKIRLDNYGCNSPHPDTKWVAMRPVSHMLDKPVLDHMMAWLDMIWG